MRSIQGATGLFLPVQYAASYLQLIQSVNKEGDLDLDRLLYCEI